MKSFSELDEILKDLEKRYKRVPPQIGYSRLIYSCREQIKHKVGLLDTNKWIKQIQEYIEHYEKELGIKKPDNRNDIILESEKLVKLIDNFLAVVSRDSGVRAQKDKLEKAKVSALNARRAVERSDAVNLIKHSLKLFTEAKAELIKVGYKF